MKKQKNKFANQRKNHEIKIEKLLLNEIYFQSWLAYNNMREFTKKFRAITFCYLDENYNKLQKDNHLSTYIKIESAPTVKDIYMPDVTDLCLKRIILHGYTLKICFCPEDYLSPFGEIFDNEAIFNMACYNAKENDYIFDGQEVYSISPYKQKEGLFNSVRISYLKNCNN